MMEGPGADSEEKRAPVSDMNTALVDRLKALDPNRPIREAKICLCQFRYWALLAARKTKGSRSNHRGRHYDDWQHRYPRDDPRQQPVNEELAERHKRQAGNSRRG